MLPKLIEGLSLVHLGLLFLCLPLVVSVFTYTSSWLQGRRRTSNDLKHEPPLVPYWIPYLQHLPQFLWDPGALYRAAQRAFPGEPFTLKLGGTKFYVFYSTATVSHVFGRSRKFSFEPVMASMMENALDLPLPDRHNFLSQSKLPGQPKFVNENHNIWTQNLSGKRLEDIMKRYMGDFKQVLTQQMDMNSPNWIKVDMYPFIRRLVFETSVATFFGPRLGQLWPNMWDDWNRYDDATYIGVRSNVAYRLQSGAYAARERMLEAFERFIETAGVDDWDEADEPWSERWGFRMNWERDGLARDHDFTLRGRACLQAGFLFVIVTNAAPMASWFTWCAARTPSSLAMYRSAALQAMGNTHQNDDSGFDKVDPTSLKDQPHIHGLWLEALRLGTVSAGARVIMDEDTELEGYLIRKGSVILMPVELMHFDPEVFADPYDMLPERWATTDKVQLKHMHNSLRPFGGGASLCSGRFVAEQEVIGAVTTLLLLFDLKFEEGSDQWEPVPRSIGVKRPRNKIVACLRRRLAKSTE